MTTAVAPWGFERLVEAVGPIVVKEVRQGLRAKVFAIFFGTLLTVCFALAVIAFAGASELGGASWGQRFFSGYLTALGAICFFVIPFVAFRSMGREVEDETWVLLTLTGLGARSITRGKWVSALSQAMLFGSACAPFVLFSYFLNGIDLVQVVVALGLAAVWTGFLTALAIAIATQGHSKLGRTVATFVVLGVLGGGAVLGVAFAWALGEKGQRLLGEESFRVFIGGLFLFPSLLSWLLLEGAAAGLALPSEAASRSPRIAFTITSLLALAFGLVIFVVEHGNERSAVAGQVMTCFFLVFGGVFCVSERDGWPRQVPGGGWLKPGGLRSFLLIVGLLVSSTALWGWLLVRASTSERYVSPILAAAAYPLLYLSLGVLLGRVSPLRSLGEPVATRIGFLLSVAVGIFGSFAFGFLTEGRADGMAPNALNPFFGLLNFLDRHNATMQHALGVLLTTTLVVTGSAAVTLIARDGVRA